MYMVARETPPVLKGAFFVGRVGEVYSAPWCPCFLRRSQAWHSSVMFWSSKCGLVSRSSRFSQLNIGDSSIISMNRGFSLRWV